MAKKLSNGNGGAFRTVINRNSSNHTGRAVNLDILIVRDLKTLVESLTSPGQELNIKSARLMVHYYTSASIVSPLQFEAALIFAVADTTFTAGDGGSDIIDTALDGRNVGEFEFKTLKICTSKIHFAYHATGANPEFCASHESIIDITGPARKAVELLSRSAILGTNPEIQILSAMSSSQSVSVDSCIVLEYSLGARKLRMMQA